MFNIKDMQWYPDELGAPIYEDVFGEEIYNGDIYYEFDGEIVAKGNEKTWFIKNAEEKIA